MTYPSALPHGEIEQVFDNVFIVTGTMRNEFFGSLWQFSRNMVIVREGDLLTLFNTVRLDEKGLAMLESLGKVTNIVRLGDMHGLDDAFYQDRHSATLWALPHAGEDDDAISAENANKRLVPGGETPISNSELFVFETTRRPEAIFRLEQEGGIMIACDALQNWLAPDDYFNDDTATKMQEMGFFTPAGVGPAWMQANEPKPEDFERLNNLRFSHVLCGHGTPLKNTAQADYAATFERLFGIRAC